MAFKMKTTYFVKSSISGDASIKGMISTGSYERLSFFHEGEDKPTEKVERSIAYMIENIDRPLRVSTLAALVDLSQSQYFALFKQQKGYSPMDYFTRLRMAHACTLLKSTSASIKQIAISMGYHDPLYFSKVFKAVINVPPSRYTTFRDGISSIRTCRQTT